MSILSKLTREESFKLVEYLESIDITTQNRTPTRYNYDAEYYAPIAIPRLAFVSNELHSNENIKSESLDLFEWMEKEKKIDDYHYLHCERDGDMFNYVSKEELEKHFDNHHITPEPQQSWQIHCNKIINSLK